MVLVHDGCLSFVAPSFFRHLERARVVVCLHICQGVDSHQCLLAVLILCAVSPQIVSAKVQKWGTGS